LNKLFNNFFREENTWQVRLLLLVIAALFFIPFIGAVHLFDWDEINFAESAREMLVSGNFLDVQINYIAFWEKPPLFFWLQVICMKLFGVNEFAARLPNAIVGIITLQVLFTIGKQLFNNKNALLWCLIYTGSILPFFYFKSGIIDPLFNLFIFLGVYQFYLFNLQKDNKALQHVFLSAVFIGLSNLTKGPVGFLIFIITAFAYMLIKKQYQKFLNWKVVLTYAFTFALVGGLWFILQILNGNYTVIIDFFNYMIALSKSKVAGHGGFMGYHFVVLLFGVFPASIFAIQSMLPQKQSNHLTQNQNDFKLWMLILFWVVLIIFTIVKTKIVHYSSMCYLPITYLALLSINGIITKNKIFKLWMKIALSIIAFVFGSVVFLLPIIGNNIEWLINSNLIKDQFTLGNLQATVSWSYIISILAFVYILLSQYFIWKKTITAKHLPHLFTTTTIFLFFIMMLVVPRIEQYSQNAAITFYKSKATEDCYIDTFGFKSYAHYFYGKMPQHLNPKATNEVWLLAGETDKPVYIVTKINRKAKFEAAYPHFNLIETKNGFCFYENKKL